MCIYICIRVILYIYLYAYIITQEKNEERHSSEGRIIIKRKRKKWQATTSHSLPLFSFFPLYLFIFTFILLRWLSNLVRGTGKVKAQKCLHTLHISIIYTEMKCLKVLINFSLCFFKWFCKFEDPPWQWKLMLPRSVNPFPSSKTSFTLYFIEVKAFKDILAWRIRHDIKCTKFSKWIYRKLD